MTTTEHLKNIDALRERKDTLQGQLAAAREERLDALRKGKSGGGRLLELEVDLRGMDDLIAEAEESARLSAEADLEQLKERERQAKAAVENYIAHWEQEAAKHFAKGLVAVARCTLPPKDRTAKTRDIIHQVADAYSKPLYTELTQSTLRQPGTVIETLKAELKRQNWPDLAMEYESLLAALKEAGKDARETTIESILKRG